MQIIDSLLGKIMFKTTFFMYKSNLFYFLAVYFLFSLFSFSQAADNKPTNPVLIQINQTKIGSVEYQAVLREEIRNKFYHSKISQEEKPNFPLLVANKMVDRFLMLEEIGKRNIKADTDIVNKKLATKMQTMDTRYENDPQWQEARQQYQSQLKTSYIKKNQLDQLSKLIKNIDQPSETDIKAYYQANPDKFMSPVQQRISVIIIGVPPSSDNKAWDSAREQAQEIKQKLTNGESFSQLAELHSTDPSAEFGGDMGSIHDGMLGDAAQKVINKLQINAVSEPITLLEGIALLKLTQRVESKLNSFERVKKQAAKILYEERSELAWKQFIFTLRQAATISIDEEKIKKLTQ